MTKGKQLIIQWLVICCTLFYVLMPVEANHEEELQTSAQAAALIDVKSGRILYSHNGDEKMLIASLTKIMTAIVAIEYGDLSDTVKVSKNAYGKEGSSIYLRLGEEMSLEHMLYGLMLRSGNDAAVAIAEHVGGSVEGFVYLMNQKAEEIGMDHSHFMNPHGLDEEGHYSTANDMAKLTAYALHNEVFREIVKTKVKQVPNVYEEWDHSWRNKNKMLSMFDGADGVKTGYTKAAGRCLVSSATIGGQQLAVVTLNDPNDWEDHTKLLNYGFEHYPLKQLVKTGQDIPGHEGWVSGSTVYYPLTEDETKEIDYEVKPADVKSVDYRLGVMGNLIFTKGEETIGSVPVYLKDDPRLRIAKDAFAEVHEQGVGPMFSRMLERMFTGEE